VPVSEADLKRLGLKRPRSKKPLVVASVSGGTLSLLGLGFLSGALFFRRRNRSLSRRERLHRRLGR
jgi:hypothetical protein